MRTRRSLPRALRAFVIRRDGGCIACLGLVGPFEVDHITPVEMGGDDAPDNLRTLCKPCHHFRHHTSRYLYGHPSLAADPREMRLASSRARAPKYPSPRWIGGPFVESHGPTS